MVGAFLAIAGAIYGLLGALHAVYTLADLHSPRRIVPDDPAVVTAMQTSKIRLTRGESTVWEGWIGFNCCWQRRTGFLGTAAATACLGAAWPLYLL
jgi:hypothetical protein